MSSHFSPQSEKRSLAPFLCSTVLANTRNVMATQEWMNYFMGQGNLITRKGATSWKDFYLKKNGNFTL